MQSGVLLCTLIFLQTLKGSRGGTIEDNEFSGPYASAPLSSRPPRIILVSRGTVLNPPLILTTKRAAVPGTRYPVPGTRYLVSSGTRYPVSWRSLKRTLSKRPLSGPRKSLDLLTTPSYYDVTKCDLREGRCGRAPAGGPLLHGRCGRGWADDSEEEDAQKRRKQKLVFFNTNKTGN